MREELHPSGLEVVTVCLEMTGPDVARPFVDVAAPTHPTLIDATHEMDAKFGVVNIPNVVWIDEDGMIVRPAEAGWPPRVNVPEWLLAIDGDGEPPPGLEALGGGQERGAYPDAIRDWVANGTDSRFVLTSAEVIERSQPRPIEVSQAAAEFELAMHLWQRGRRDAAIAHFNECHRLQPSNWTYKRQAWSLIGRERVEGEWGLFMQSPSPDDDWPFDTDFAGDVAKLDKGEYFPKTM
jgi:hypothetical protein